MAAKKYSKIIIRTVLVIALIVLLWFLLPKLLMLFLPFILGYIVASLISPVVNKIDKRFKIPHKLTSLIVLVLTISVIGWLFVTLFMRVGSEIKSFSVYLPDLINTMHTKYSTLSERLDVFSVSLPQNIRDIISSLLTNVLDNLVALSTDASKKIIQLATDITMRLPTAFIFTIVFLMSSYFMTADKDKISAMFVKTLPKNFLSKTVSLKKDLIFALGGYFKTQLTLMCIVFVILFIGFSIMGNEYAVIAALIISLFDALPFFGSGIFLIPWSVLGFLNSDIKTGTIAIIMYVIIVVTRQLLEPKLFGDRIGMHPLLTLMAMYVGLRLIGFFGLILGPLIVIIVKNLATAGVFDELIKDIKELIKGASDTDEQ